MGQIELVLAMWVILASIVSAADVPGGYYQTKYEALDVEDVLNHKRLVHHYVACLLNRGPCPPQGADLRRILPESIETACLRCTEKQRTIILTTIRRLRAEYPSLWKELLDFYDPTEEGIRRIENTIDKQLSGDEANFIGNRFGNSDFGNDLAAPVNPVSPVSTYLPPSTTARPITTTAARPSTTTAARPSTTTVARPSTTTKSHTSGSSAKPLAILPSDNVGIVDTPTTRPPSFLTRWRLTTIPTGSDPYGWRPSEQTLQPFDIPLLKVDAGIRFLGSLGDLGSRVIQAGTEVAGLMLSKVQLVFGGQPVN